MSVLLSAVFLGACGTLLDINPDTQGPSTVTGDAGEGGPIRATGGDCVFDDPASKLDDVCGFGP